jgi:hypothetical protein
MRRARIVRIEWDDRDLEPTDEWIQYALALYLGAINQITVTGEPSFEVKEDIF